MKNIVSAKKCIALLFLFIAMCIVFAGCSPSYEKMADSKPMDMISLDNARVQLISYAGNKSKGVYVCKFTFKNQSKDKAAFKDVIKVQAYQKGKELSSVNSLTTTNSEEKKVVPNGMTTITLFLRYDPENGKIKVDVSPKEAESDIVSGSFYLPLDGVFEYADLIQHA